MAKKVVATLRDKTKGAGMAKVIRAIKNKETVSYSFKEEIVPSEMVQDLIKSGK